MSPTPVDDPAATADTGRGAPLTRPRPGHADLVGALKYGYDDVRDALERASARETAARVVVGTLAKNLLAEVGVTVLSHVLEIGGVGVEEGDRIPGPDDLDAVDEDPVRAFDAAASKRMQARVDEAYEHKDTLGGVVEVITYGLPPGLGSHVHWDRKLDTRLAAACMSVQAMKGVEVGDGFRTAARPGSRAHDELEYTDGTFTRTTNRAGGLEAGMTNGEPLIVRVAMKPLSSLMRPLKTVDLRTKEEAEAITQRSDVNAVPRAGVVLEAVVAIELANALLEKTGGDTVAEVKRNLAAYVDEVASR